MFNKLLQIVPHLTECLMKASNEESTMVVNLIPLTVTLRFTNSVYH